jgi:cytidylate kinase
MIITIARECGSGGHEIGEQLAKEFGIELYDKKRLMQEAIERSDFEDNKEFFDETPMNSLLYGIAMSYGEPDVQKRSLNIIREITAGKDFVIIGRCSNYIYRNHTDVTTVFTHADQNYRVQHLMKGHQITQKQACGTIKEVDEKRRTFHKRCTGEDWGQANHYQLTLDTGLIGIDSAVEVIKDYINNKNKNKN